MRSEEDSNSPRSKSSAAIIKYKTAPIFEPVAAPIITSLNRTDLLEWIKRRNKYEKKKKNER